MSNLLKDNLALMSEYDFEKNKSIDLDEIKVGSHKKVWWICPKNHEYSTPVYRRQVSGCPYCSNQKVLIGYNDLKSQFPNLMKEWDSDKNKELGLSPDKFVFGSTKKVWWKCNKCSYSWETSIVNRTKGLHKCPMCAPKLNRKVQLENQIKKEGSLFSNYPLLMKEWDYKRNKVDPKTLVSKSSYRAHWICNLGHKWEAIVTSRTRANGTGCPFCKNKKVLQGFNDLKTINPILASEWDYEKNKTKPDDYLPHSEKKVWWKCQNCGESYYSAISHRSNGTNCPNCSKELHTSFPEQAIYYYIKKEFKNAENRYKKLGFELDIYIPGLEVGIEYDGAYFHNSKRSVAKEKEKYNNCKKNNIYLIRVREKSCNLTEIADKTIVIENNSENSLEKAIQELFQILQTKFDIKQSNKIDIKKDRHKIYSEYILSKKDNSLESLFPDIASEWDYDNNEKLMPDMVIPGSTKKVWWICNKCNQSYISSIAMRVNGIGCPYCSHQKVLTGTSDLATIRPDIAKEWDYDKNDKTPDMVMPASNKKYYWICKKGHSYLATPNSRTSKVKKASCPYCSGRKVLTGYNDLAHSVPAILDEWDFTKNSISPENITSGSQKKVWWTCNKCGNSYNSSVHLKVNLGLNKGCPYCSNKKVKKGYNDLGTKLPNVIEEWDYNKNKIKPDEIVYLSTKKVWWTCKSCNNSWQADPYHRFIGQGCPKCKFLKSGKRKIANLVEKNGSLMDNYPNLMKEWDYEKNDLINTYPDKITSGSHKKAWWICSKCGHSWETEIRVRSVRGNNCPKCKK